MSKTAPPQPPPPQPETIVLECSNANSIVSSSQNDEWECKINPPVKLEQGDELSVNQSFLEARGTATEILEFSSSGLNKNNKQRIYFEFYCSDDGTNDKNKGRDWDNFGTHGQRENAHTYKPCKAFRYDNLLDKSFLFSNGQGFSKEVSGIRYEAITNVSIDPRIANAFNINFKEDLFVGGVFNSVNALREVRHLNPQLYIGDANTANLTAQQKVLTMTDFQLNFDAFDYWEAVEYGQTIEFRVPFELAGTNHIAGFPIGTVVHIDWMFARRQDSYYTAGNAPVDIKDNSYVALGGAVVNGAYKHLEHIDHAVGSLCGHFLITDNNVITTFADNGTTQTFGFAGRPAVAMRFSKITSQGTPAVNHPSVINAGRKQTSAGGDDLCNPYTTSSKTNLLALATTDFPPVNLCIKKSPHYIGSMNNQYNTATLQYITDLIPRVVGRAGTYYNQDTTTDPNIMELFPKNPANPTFPVPMNVGAFHKTNTGGDFTNANPDTRTDEERAKFPFSRLSNDDGSTPIELIDYYTCNTANPYAPMGVGTHTLVADLTPTSTFIEVSFVAPAHYSKKTYLPTNQIVVINRGTAEEECILTGGFADTKISDNAGAKSLTPTKAKITIIARNVAQNQALFSNIGASIPNGRILFNPIDPVGYMDGSGALAGFTYDTYTHNVGTEVAWFDFQEATHLQIEFDSDLFVSNFPHGLPITKSYSYWGSNEPVKNTDDASLWNNDDEGRLLINNTSYYSNDLKDLYKQGYSYFFYFNHRGTTAGANANYSNRSLPDMEQPLQNGDNHNFAGRLGMNRGCFMWLLNEGVVGDSDLFKTDSTTISNPIYTTQIKASSTSATKFTAGIGQGYAPFNTHIYMTNMEMDFEIDKANVNPDGTRTSIRSFFQYFPDIKQSFIEPRSQLSLNNNTGVYSLLGYVPLINSIDVETPKDYLTPDDLSQYWTEQLHKTTNVKCLLDGHEIPNSKDRGLIHNQMLMPIYGSWGYGNHPTASGLLARDYFTFPFTNGYALGSVIFLDGNEVAQDWGVGETNINKTFPIYPRSPENLVHLWKTADTFTLPNYTITRITTFNPTNPAQQYTTYQPIDKTYTFAHYPVAPSGTQNNTNASNNLPAVGNNGFGASATINETNLSYTLPKTNQRGEPAYSSNPLDQNDLFTTASQTDEPFTGTKAPREDSVYRETIMYPLHYLNDATRSDYIRFSQYVGTDNATLTYNPNVSAFEYQFLHQPFATSFSIQNNQGTGGDNAVRIFDNIPTQMNNWERYSGINVRNWATPLINRNELTYGEIQTTPSYLTTLFPNGLNPETDLDVIGSRFMNKLGYALEQYKVSGATDPTAQGTNVKGREGMGLDDTYQYLYTYEPNGSTGADVDTADAIINTTTSAEDNPNSEAHGGRGQLIFYPDAEGTLGSTGDSTKGGVRYDYSYTRYGQRGGLKTENHNKSMGFPNIVGTPLVEDQLSFPRTLNPDGEQRSGYTIEIGSTPVRAKFLPIKLTDGYYYILAPDLIDDPQFYITANNGSVIPAIALVSKTYVSGDFYTTFQSPLSWYVKQPKVISSIKIQIRNSSMGVPSNLGANSSVIFSVKRYNPQPYTIPMDITTQQSLDYKLLNQNRVRGGRLEANVKRDFLALGASVLNPQLSDADYIQGLQDRINHYDIPNMSHAERRDFFENSEVGRYLGNEIQSVLALDRAVELAEAGTQTLSAVGLLSDAVRLRASEALGGLDLAVASPRKELALREGFEFAGRISGTRAGQRALLSLQDEVYATIRGSAPITQTEAGSLRAGSGASSVGVPIGAKADESSGYGTMSGGASAPSTEEPSQELP